MRKAATKKPLKALPRPHWKPRHIVFGIVTNKKFDMVIMGIILVNMVSCVEGKFQHLAFGHGLISPTAILGMEKIPLLTLIWKFMVVII